MTDTTNIRDITITRIEVNKLPTQTTMLCTQKTVGAPPSYFCKARVQIWHEIIDSCVDGLIQTSDRITLEVMVNLVHHQRTEPETFDHERIAHLHKLTTDYGLSPKGKIKLLKIWSLYDEQK